MIELYIKNQGDKKQIAVVDNGKLQEYYEEGKNSKRNEGNIYIGIVGNIVEGMQSAFVNIGTEKNSLIHSIDILPKIDKLKGEEEVVNIKDLVEPGQKLLVQVKRDSNNKKGARISTHINLPSKYIVFMPNTDIITVSQKIENKEERQRLIDLVRENIGEGNGAVIRTSAEGKNVEIIDDIKFVKSKWNSILETGVDPGETKPRLLYVSEDIVEKILIDYDISKINKIVVNEQRELERLKKLQKKFKEYHKIKIEKQEVEQIFNIYKLEEQIEKIQNRKVWLKCGGFITIDKTEALVAIDVNTGKYTGKKELEETIFTVNKEATIEIAKQLKLRDIGGIIIIDYIDMQKEEHKEEIEKILIEELKKDRAKTQVEGFTKLDLMELTRKHICSHKE